MKQNSVFRQKMVVFSMAVQTVITLLVILFCMFQLRQVEDAGNKAVLYSILTGTVAYWFPSPISITAEEEQERQRQMNKTDKYF